MIMTRTIIKTMGKLGIGPSWILGCDWIIYIYIHADKIICQIQCHAQLGSSPIGSEDFSTLGNITNGVLVKGRPLYRLWRLCATSERPWLKVVETYNGMVKNEKWPIFICHWYPRVVCGRKNTKKALTNVFCPSERTHLSSFTHSDGGSPELVKQWAPEPMAMGQNCRSLNGFISMKIDRKPSVFLPETKSWNPPFCPGGWK